MGFFTSPLNEEVMHTKGGKREMKKVLLIIGLFLITSLSWGMLSIEEAMQAIREFEGIPDLKLKYERLTNEYSDPWGVNLYPTLKLLLLPGLAMCSQQTTLMEAMIGFTSLNHSRGKSWIGRILRRLKMSQF
jgi:hypothetical protein